MQPLDLANNCVGAATPFLTRLRLLPSTDMCVGVTCPAQRDECETRRKTCVRATGLCTAPPKENGTLCSIGSCQGGVCTGGWGLAPRRGGACLVGRPPYRARTRAAAAIRSVKAGAAAANCGAR
jgi:hypothetical protein